MSDDDILLREPVTLEDIMREVKALRDEVTLRDYFAARAMQSIVAEADWMLANADTVARDAYRIAAAMLKARESDE
jgi:hypothetical protein